MGEIKSTLDLVLERTRHLSLSPEEKAAQRREEFEKRLQGLLQQYVDEAQTVDAILERMAALQREMQVAALGAPAAAVLGRIDPDGENGPWLELLARLAPETGAALETLLDTHRRDRRRRLETAERILRDRLGRDYGITGSAAVPNPMKDAGFRNDLEALRNETLSAIEALGGGKER